MNGGPETPAMWWTVPAAHHVSYLVAVDPDLLSVALDPLPDGAPAVVRFRPTVRRPLGDQVTVLLDELDRAAIDLFPRWLPGAERLDGPHRLGTAAVRALAAERAARTENFGPFLADMAERGLQGRTGERSGFPAEVRAAGLARIVAAAYGRESAVLLIDIPDGLASGDERTLVAAAEWFAQFGHFTVWLAGAPLIAIDHVTSVRLALPPYLTELAEAAGSVEADDADAVDAGPTLIYAPLAGQPRHDSAAEQALERALARHEWAQGRMWNHRYERDLLAKVYRLDLFWPSDGLVVEVDGPDHRERHKFADDRQRDVQLQLLGHDVLRFTNEQVLYDVRAVTQRIEKLLAKRRSDRQHHTEKRQHVDH